LEVLEIIITFILLPPNDDLNNESFQKLLIIHLIHFFCIISCWRAIGRGIMSQVPQGGAVFLGKTMFGRPEYVMISLKC